MKLVLSIIENLIEGLILWKIAFPVFLENYKYNHWAILGILSIILIIIILEYKSYKENKSAWLVSILLDRMIK